MGVLVKRFFCFGSLIILCGIVGSCGWGHRALTIRPPYAALESAVQETDSNLLVESEGWIPREWWCLFQDDQLKEFILTAFRRNPTLQEAQAQILLAIARAEKIRANLFPLLIGSADASAQKISKTGVIPFGTTNIPNTPESRIPVYFRLYEIQAKLTYEFDVWGKNRNALCAAIGEVKSNIADNAFAHLQLGISIAQVYYFLQINYKLQQIAKALVTNRENYLKLVQQRVQDNLDNGLNLSLIEAQLAEVRQALLQIEGETAVYEHQLKAFLAENFEETICPVHIVEQPLPRVPLPCTLPLNLISHRPDIMAQLWLIKSACKRIEVARAQFYPDFNLSALFGFQTIHFRELFKWPSTYYNIGPAVSLPIFDGGWLLGNLHESQINYDLAVFEYNNLILNAVKEVLDGIALVTYAEKELGQAKEALDSQEHLLYLSALRVEHNLDSNLDFLNNEANFLNAQNQEVTALGNTLQGILSLIKALGGGYDCQ